MSTDFGTFGVLAGTGTGLSPSSLTTRISTSCPGLLTCTFWWIRIAFISSRRTSPTSKNAGSLLAAFANCLSLWNASRTRLFATSMIWRCLTNAWTLGLSWTRLGGLSRSYKVSLHVKIRNKNFNHCTSKSTVVKRKPYLPLNTLSW